MSGHNIDELDALLNEVEEAIKPSPTSRKTSAYDGRGGNNSYSYNKFGSENSSGLSDYRGKTPPSDNSQQKPSFSTFAYSKPTHHSRGSGGYNNSDRHVSYKENTPPPTPPGIGDGFDSPTPRGYKGHTNSIDNDSGGDLDDLLGMTENLSAKDSKQNKYNSKRGFAKRRFHGGPIPVNTLRRRSSEKQYGQGNQSRSSGSSSDSVVLLGGTACTLGDEPSKFRRVVNDHLLCLKCMCEVVRFENVVWTKDADYIFFRNFWPDGDRLCEKMKPQEGFAAYCCQCCWANADEVQPIEHFSCANGNLKWRNTNNM